MGKAVRSRVALFTALGTIVVFCLLALVSAAQPAVAQTGDDWPQLQHDPQRTGYSSLAVRPPYVYLWKWNEVPFASRTQPVLSSGRLFIGGLDGAMYARNALTGAPLWRYPTGGPIRHSAAVYQDHVFFGSHDTYVYALDAASGQLAWRYKTGGGIATAPAVANNTVYIGSADGIFYALSTADGRLRWSYTVGVPILTAAALSVDGATVYFGAENITAYALNATDGRLRWKTHLQGQSLAERWPVVVGSTVIYVSQSLRNFHALLHEGDDVMDQAGAVDPAWSADWAKVRPEIVSYLKGNPDRQTSFVLDAGTGSLRGPAPVLYTYGNGDSPAPPAVRGQEIFLRYRARHGIQTDAGSVHVTTRYDSELGRMNLSSLDIAGLGLTSGQRWNLQFRATSDEPAALSMGGSMLFVDSWTRLGGIDVDTGKLFEVANVADDWPDCNGQCDGRTGPMPFFSSYPFPGPHVGEGNAHHAAVIANGVIYWRLLGGALAAIGHSSGGQSTPYVWTSTGMGAEQQPLVPAPSVSSAASAGPQALSDYVWTEPTRPVPNPDLLLVARLEKEVQAMVNAGHLAPFYIERGFTTPQGYPGDSDKPEEGRVQFGPSGNVYWYDPGELAYTLSLVYPYLSPDLQNQLRAYLRSEMERYSPLEPLPYPSTWLKDGVRRESYAMTVGINVWPPPAPPLSTLYALWAYADATGDWGYLGEHWTAIRDLFDGRKGEVDSYAAISGAIGYARIASHLGYVAAAREGEQVAVAAMTAGQSFSSFREAASQRYPDPRGKTTGLRAPVFFGLVPEVGRYLRDTNVSAIATYLDALTHYPNGEFLWYLTRLGTQVEVGESSFHGPEVAWSVYLAKAYIQRASPAELRRYLDRPWGLGDLYYLQKLVAAIDVGGAPDLSLSAKQVSDATPAGGEAITYTVTLRNSGTPFTSTVSVTDVIPTALSLVPNSLSASSGNASYVSGSVLWNGSLASDVVTLRFGVVVQQTDKPKAVVNTVVIDAGAYGQFTCSSTIIVNGRRTYLPMAFRSWNGRGLALFVSASGPGVVANEVVVADGHTPSGYFK